MTRSNHWWPKAGAGFLLVILQYPLFAGALVQSWAERYGRPGNRYDLVYAIALDTNGNLFVTGTGATVGYSSAGIPLWTNLHQGDAKHMVTDAAGNVFVAAGLYTIKYSNQGVPLWTNRFDSPEIGLQNGNGIRGLALDGNSGVVVTGADEFYSSFNKFVTIKYSGDGQALWTNRHHMGKLSTAPDAVTTDPSGNVFVTGRAERDSSPTTWIDVATVAYSASGALLWERYYDSHYTGPEDMDLGSAIAVDGNGDIVVGGSVGFRRSMLVIKYSLAGSQIWAVQHPHGAGYPDEFRAMALDRDGNIFITGASSRFSDGGADFLTIKYSPDGTTTWSNRFGAPGVFMSPRAMALDESGNLFIAGQATDSVTSEFLTLALSNKGAQMWTQRYKGPVLRSDYAYAITADRRGNVFVTGQSIGSGTNNGSASDYDYVTIKYAPPLPIGIQKVNDQVVLTWSNSIGSLQAAPSLTATFTNLPGVTSPHTNPVTGAQRFFRAVAN